jgi:LytR cell envelope-related transcriptional attenuator
MPAPLDAAETVAGGISGSDDAQSAYPGRGGRGRLERARRDRRAQGAIVGVALVVGLIAGSLGSNGSHTARALAPAVPTTAPPAAVPGRTALIAHVDKNHRVDLIAMAGIDPGGRTGNIVFVPTTTLVEVPSFETQALVDVVRLGGASGTSLFATTLENAIGIHFNEVMVVNDKRLTALLAPAERLNVNFVRSVEVDDASGTLAYTPGRATISSSDATRLLLGPANGGALEHLVAVQAVLEGWFGRLRVAAVAHATQKVSPSAAMLTRLAHASINFDTLPVDVLSSGTVTRYELQEPAADQLAAADFPSGIITKKHRPRVEVLNGTGAVALTQAVARLVVPAGGEITLTGNVPGFGIRHTSVVYYRPADRIAAKHLARALGVGTVAEGNVPLDVVDLTVVVGADFHPGRS